jgi:hypothetical protein
MHVKYFSTAFVMGNSAGRITNKGVGSILGSVTVAVIGTTPAAVQISDKNPAAINAANSITLVPAGAPVGTYHIPLNVISMTGDWYTNCATNSRVIVTTPTPMPGTGDY